MAHNVAIDKYYLDDSSVLTKSENNFDASSIPSEDPQAALEFCKKLSQLLSRTSSTQSTEAAAVKNLSVVIPVLNEETGLSLLLERLISVIQIIEPSFEIILVDDGSIDRSVAIAEEWAKRDSRISLLQLARNFGHQSAISAGLDYAFGKAVLVMDADLQDPPEVIPELYKKWTSGYEVVYGIRENRKESILKRSLYSAFYRLLKTVANISIPPDSGDFCIMDQAVVQHIRAMPERTRFLRGIRAWIGFRQIGIPYDRGARFADKTKYSYTRLVSLALDGIISFGFRPLRAISLLGVFISMGAVALAFFYAYKRVYIGLSPPGFATTIVAVLFLAGVQLFTVGLIGEYVGRIFEEVKRRPLYIVKRVVRGDGNAQTR